MPTNSSDLVLYGNAAAGLVRELFPLRELFPHDVATAQIQCRACGFASAVGSLPLYAVPMGAVLRCTHCDGILMRAAHTPHARWLEMPGALRLRSQSLLPDGLAPEWIEPAIEGNERLGTVVQIPKRARNNASTLSSSGLPSYKLQQAIEFVEAHIHEAINLERLAAAVGLSPFHFHRQFKRSTGLTPGKYIFQRRILRAKTLLSTSDLPLVEVAAKAGFADQSHLTAAFGKATSMTPRTYRNATATARSCRFGSGHETTTQLEFTQPEANTNRRARA